MKHELERDRIRLSFDRAAPGYDEAAVLQREVEERLLERLAYQPLDPRRVLDLGAGPGRASERLGRQFPAASVVAGDLALGMLGRHERAGYGRVVCDAVRLPFPDACFDLVFSNLMLPWVNDPLAVFRELRRVVRPGGLVLFSTLGPDTLRELRLAWEAVDDAVHVHEFIDMHHLGDALIAAGFDAPVMDMERLTVTYGEVGGLLHDLRATGATNADSRRRRQLTGRRRLEAMAGCYRERFGIDGRIPATCEIVYGHALGPPPGRPLRQGAGEEVAIPVDALRGSRRRR